MRKNRVFSIFYSGRHEKPTETNIMRMIAPSILGVAVCIICLAGMTWAWFSDTGYSGTTKLTGANFNITAMVTDSSGSPITTSGVANRWELNRGEYTVNLTATGTSRTGGYGLVSLNGSKYNTVQIYPESTPEETGKTYSITFTVNISGTGVVLAVTPQWGQATDVKIQASESSISDSSSTTTPSEPSGDPNQEEGPGIVEPNPTEPTNPTPTEPDSTEPAPTEPDPTEPAPTEPDPTEPITDPTEAGGTENPEEPKEILYTVQPGDRLGSIASQFGLTWPELAEYNGLEDPDHIEVGQVLRIPPVA